MIKIVVFSVKIMTLCTKIAPSLAAWPFKAQKLPYLSNLLKMGGAVRMALIFAFTAFSAAQANAETAYVVKVLDGDTIQIRQDGKYFRVRLANIDAPEKNQPHGLVAAASLRSIIYNRIVDYRKEDTDRYGRIVATVVVGSTNVNRAMACSGNAWAYREYLRDREVLKCEAEARRRGIGLWRLSSPIAPWDWRKRTRHSNLQPVKSQHVPSEYREYNSSQFANCAAVRAAGKAPIYAGQPGYSRRLDRDGDGVGCE